MSSFLPQFGAGTPLKKAPSFSQQDNVFTSTRGVGPQGPTFNPTISSSSGDYYSSQGVIMTAPSESYTEPAFKKAAANPTSAYHVKSTSESSKPFIANKNKCAFNIDIANITNLPSDTSAKSPAKRIYTRPQKISDDKDSLAFASASALANDNKSPYERTRPDKYGDINISPFELPSIQPKSGSISSRGDYASEAIVKPVSSTHTKQIYQQTALQLLGGAQETPRVGIVKFNSATNLPDISSGQYSGMAKLNSATNLPDVSPNQYNHNDVNNQSSRGVPPLSIQNLPRAPYKVEPGSARARLGYDSSQSVDSPFNVGLHNPKTSAFRIEKLAVKKVISLKDVIQEPSQSKVYEKEKEPEAVGSNSSVQEVKVTSKGSLAELDPVPTPVQEKEKEKPTQRVKKGSFDLLGSDTTTGSYNDIMVKMRVASQPCLDTPFALVKSPSLDTAGKSVFIFDEFKEAKKESSPLSEGQSAQAKKAVKPILRVREPAQSPNDPFLKPTAKKVVFDLVKEEDEEEEAVARPKFKLKLKKKVQKPETKPTLKSILWGVAVPGILKDSIKNKHENRHIRNKEFAVNFNSDKLVFLQFTVEYLREPLLKLAQDKSKLSITGPKGSIKDINARCAKIHDHAIALLNHLKVALEANYLPKPIYHNIVYSFMNGVCVPDYYLSEFELSRLQFTPSFSLKCVNANRSKMLIGGYIILRILILEVVMRPWQALAKVQASKVDMSNLQTVGSILYHALKDIFAEILEPVKTSPEPQHSDKKVKAGLEVPVASETSQDVVIEEDKEEIMKGFENRDDLFQLIEERPAIYQDIKQYLQDILGYLHRVTLKGQKKERGF